MLEDRAKLLLRKTLQYTNGYRELEMFSHAITELDTLPDHLSQLDESIQMRLAVHIDASQWNEALPIAKRLAERHSDKSEHIVNLAFVTRRARTLAEARILLLDAAERFPGTAIIHYNLGCYACMRESPQEAKSYLKEAFALDVGFMDTALEDEDLSELKDWIESLKEE